MNKLLSIFLLYSLSATGEVIISPNMNLPVPIVSQTTGPEWADDINSCMSSIDSHDHTPGKGVPISSEAINISSDLPLNNNSLTSAKAVVFSSQSSFPTNQSLYVEAPDLFYNDGNGNVVRITQSGSVSGASGTITGLPSGTASASYQSVGGTFQFQSATNTPANITGASVTIAEQVASVTPNGVTLKAPSGLAASYNLTLPTSVPSFSSLLSMSTGGALSTVPASAPAFQSLLSMSASGVVTTVPYKAPTIQKFLSGSGTYTTPTSPGPIYIQIEMVGAGGGGGAVSSNTGASGGATTFGTALLSAGGGGGAGAADSLAPAGGVASLGAASGIAVDGGRGGSGFGNSSASVAPSGGMGGVSAFGGGGTGGQASNPGQPAATNSGSGGGGGGGNSSSNGAPGGSAGAYIKALISAPSATYPYSVGAGGGGASAGGVGGGAGGSGQIIVWEFYQ